MGVDFCDQVMTMFLNLKKKKQKIDCHQHKTGLSRRNFNCRVPLVLDHWY